MIEDADDGRRGSMGRHHGARRGSGAELGPAAMGIRRILVVSDPRSAALFQVVAHLARSLRSSVLVAASSAGEAASISIAADVETEVFAAPARSDLLRAAMLADLVVVRRASGAETHRSIAALARASACPILQVPAAPSNTRPGHRVLVLWDGSSQAARLLRDARPLLRDACALVIVDAGRSGATPAASDAVAYLERHGFEASSSERFGRGLPELVAVYAPDLLVMAVGPAPMFARSESFDDHTVVLSNG